MSALPDDVRSFLLAHFDSVETIEIASLLRRSPETYWAAVAVSQQLGISQSFASAKLADLVRAGLLVQGNETGAFRFSPRTDDIRSLTDRLLELYSEKRVSVINTIYSANLERLKAFSSAFKLKNE